jgi:hypothetical protein
MDKKALEGVHQRSLFFLSSVFAILDLKID